MPAYAAMSLTASSLFPSDAAEPTGVPSDLFVDDVVDEVTARDVSREPGALGAAGLFPSAPSRRRRSSTNSDALGNTRTRRRSLGGTLSNNVESAVTLPEALVGTPMHSAPSAPQPCLLSRRELIRILQRCRLDGNDDLFDCYFVMSSELTTTPIPLCRACGTQPGEHNAIDVENSSPRSSDGGSLRRAPRKPLVVDDSGTVRLSVRQSPAIGAVVGVAVAVACLTLAIVHGNPLYCIGIALGCAVAIIGLALVRWQCLSFDHAAKTFTRRDYTAACPCCPAESRWSYRDIAGISIIASEARQGSSATVSPTIFTVALELRADASFAEFVTPQPDAAELTVPVTVQTGVSAVDIAEVEADWNFFITSITDPL
jgi:hypothetical protein